MVVEKKDRKDDTMLDGWERVVGIWVGNRPTKPNPKLLWDLSNFCKEMDKLENLQHMGRACVLKGQGTLGRAFRHDSGCRAFTVPGS